MANTLTFANQTLTDADIFGGVSYTADLNTGDAFTIGNTASASVSFVTDKQVPLYSSDATNGKFTWTQDGVSRGRFYVTEATQEADKYTVTAYDAMMLLETDISALSLTVPLSVSAAASAIAAYIGCTVSGTVYNGAMAANYIEEGTAIRQLLGHVAEASGASVKVDGSDHLCFMYYADSGITITDVQYKEFGLKLADYTCAAIDNVTILNALGSVQAVSGSGTNSLFIENNPFLVDATNTTAATILARVSGLTYVPLTCEMFEEYGLTIGTAATFGSAVSLVMHIESNEEGAVVSSEGVGSRADYNKSLSASIASAMSTIDLRVDYDIEGGLAVFRATVFQGDVNVTSQYDASLFGWYRKTEDYQNYPDGKIPLGTGYRMPVSLSTMEYGGVIRCEVWIEEQNYITDSVGGNITDSSDGIYIAAL